MSTFLNRTVASDGTVTLTERTGTIYESVNLSNIPTDTSTHWVQLAVVAGLGFLLGSR